MDSSDEDDYLTIEEKKYFLNQAIRKIRTNVEKIQKSIEDASIEIKTLECDLKLSHNELKQQNEEQETLQLEADSLEEKWQTLNLESDLVELKYTDIHKKVQSIGTLEPVFEKGIRATLTNMNSILNLMSQEGFIALQPCPYPKSESLSITPSATETLPLVQPKRIPVPLASKNFPKVQPKSLTSTPVSSATEWLPMVEPKSFPSTPVPSASKRLPLVQPNKTQKEREQEEEEEEEEEEREEEEEEEEEEEREEEEEEKEEGIEEEKEDENMEVSYTETRPATKLPQFLHPYIPKKKSPNDKWPLNYSTFLNYYFETSFNGKVSKEVTMDCIQQGIKYNIFPSKQSSNKLCKQVYTRLIHLKRQSGFAKKSDNTKQ